MWLAIAILTILVVLVTIYHKRIIGLHAQIQGQWLAYLPVVADLAWRKRKHPRGRLDLHDVFGQTLEDGGLVPFKQAIENDLPKQKKYEDLYIYGFNNAHKSRVRVQFKRRPLPATSEHNDEPKDKVWLDFSLEDGKGNTYWLKEETVVDFSATEYRGAGFAFEMLTANKTGRIKFRGYMHRNDDKSTMHFVRIRLLTLFYSKTYDHQREFDVHFLAQEVMHQGGLSQPDKKLEDRIEQYCHIKGTVVVDQDDETDEPESELHFLALVGRRYFPTQSMPAKRFVRLSGGNKNGALFQLGLIETGKTSFRFGTFNVAGERFFNLTSTTLSKEHLKQLEAKEKNKTINFTASFDEKPHEFEFRLHQEPWWIGKIDGIDATAILENVEYQEIDECARKDANIEELKKKMSEALVVSFQDSLATKVELTGGKGASLAQLYKLSKIAEDKFKVPDGLVVTCCAYDTQILSMRNFFTQLSQLQQAARDRTALEAKCAQFSKWFAEHDLEQTIKTSLEKGLRAKFGADFERIKFSVRSSAAMEDSSEMSAAGQMTTFLGVKGFASLAQAVVKCWASQFEFVAIEYKRGYGQELNSPMAVVVQQMVACEAAGVIFTAHPINGDERLLTITSNFGLGESVVSAAADPDYFQIEVNITQNRMEAERRVTRIVSKTLGKKSLVTRMHDQDDVEGVRDEKNAHAAHVASLNDEQVVTLGEIALLIHRYYGNARDIEWGYKQGMWYMLQSRPITNLDSSFTSYELMHEMDTPHMNEREIYSRSHWGENFPGSSTWLVQFFHNNQLFLRNQIKAGSKTKEDYQPFRPGMGYVTNQLFFNLESGSFNDIFADYPNTEISKALVLAFFGRHLTDPDVLQCFQKERPSKKLFEKFFFIFMLYKGVWAMSGELKKAKKEIYEENKSEIAGYLDHYPLRDKLDYIGKRNDENFKLEGLHGPASFSSSFLNFILFKMLRTSNDDEEMVNRDCNLLLSHCNDVISAEVPRDLREIALAIENKSCVAAMSNEELLAYLRSGNTKAAQLLGTFLQKHGHRGYREFDPYRLPWGKNAMPVVEVIKSILKGLDSYKPKEKKLPEQLLEEIETRLPKWKKLLMAKFILKACQNGVGYRENTKALMIKINDSTRQAYWALADSMWQAGYIPEKELFFFLKIDEVHRMLHGDRNPTLLMKARQRRKLYPTMNDLKYDEFIKGFRMRPRNLNKPQVKIEGSVALKGTAVTVGAVKARVCVAETIEQAGAIEQGDVLVTYSTDIGWSPYFPLISGIVTEIGGVISHGSVIAREFGIPCLIAVEGACAVFRTGDMVYLDTKTATISKIG